MEFLSRNDISHNAFVLFKNNMLKCIIMSDKPFSKTNEKINEFREKLEIHIQKLDHIEVKLKDLKKHLNLLTRTTPF